ncbi:MAG: CHASE3 domain-containing protein [Candidatus Binatia bacterium]
MRRRVLLPMASNQPAPTPIPVPATPRAWPVGLGAALAFGLTLLVTLATTALSYWNLQAIRRDEHQVRHTHDVLAEIQAVFSTLQDTETGQRGYLITGDGTYLGPYIAGVNRIGEQRARLRALTRDDAAQAPRVAALEARIDAKLDELQRVIDARREKGVEFAQLAVRGGEGKRIMEGLRETIAELEQHENAERVARMREADSALRSARAAALTAGLLGVGVIGFAFLIIRREMIERQRAHEALRGERERLQVTLRSIGDAVITTDAEGRVTFLNPVAEELTGWTNVAAAAQPLATVFPIVNERSRAPVDNPALEALKTGCIVGLANHTVLIARDGTEVPIDDRAAPIRDAQDRITGAVLVFRDIGEKRRSQQRIERELRFLADASEALIGSIDYEATLSQLTRAAVPMLGDFCFLDVLRDDGTIDRVSWAHDTAAKQALFDARFGPGQPRAAICGPIAAVLRGGGAALEPAVDDDWLAGDDATPDLLQFVRSVGCRSFVSVPIVVRGRIHGALSFCYGPESGLAHDAGQLALAEELARRAAAAIETTHLYEALRESDRRKDHFLATLAHELRNPLAPISNALQLWPRVEHDPARMEQLRGIMERQLRQMTRLIDDLLDLSRISRGKIQLRRQPVAIATMIDGAVEAMRPFIEACRHELIVQLPADPVYVEVDVARLVQVLGNLLHNAAKYTGRNGHLTISAAHVADQAVIEVRDDGPGIPPTMLAQIFDMFTQVDATLERAHGGLGIGLTLVKTIVELHGGHVEARSDGQGRGSAFIVHLPALAAAPQVGARTAPAGAERGRHRILVVDDVQASAATLALMLEPVARAVFVAFDGPSAIEVARSQRPDVVFLDIAMPGMNGYEVAARLRQEPMLNGLTLVALTGYGQEEDRRRATAAGFDHLMVKPASMEELEGLLATIASAPSA